MAKLGAPKFAFGPEQVIELALTLPTTMYTKGLMAVGGNIEGDSGLGTGYVVRDDEILFFSLRFYETEWPDVQDFIDEVMDGQVFRFFPVSDDDTESYLVTLESPAVNTTYAPTPDGTYPRMLTLPIVLRAPSFDSPATAIREFQEDFETPLHTVSHASTLRRPDAISLDYLQAAAPGPDQLADVSLGPTVRKWKIRCLGDTVYIARANDDNTDWEPEDVLFTFTNAIADPILELDLAFTQAGSPVVCAERPTGIWLYWFDPTVPGNVFVLLGDGRTPRCVLDQDDPRDSNSDVLVFYVNDAAHSGDGAICYRVQRERYEDEHEAPIFGEMTLDVVAGDPDIHELTGDGLSGIDGEEVEGTFRITVPADLNTNGILSPPYPHVDNPPLGDFMLLDVGVFIYRLVLEFNKPIRNVSLQQFYPLDAFPNSMFIAAVKERTDFTGIGGATYDAADIGFFPNGPVGTVGPFDASVTVNDGFRFLVIDSPIRLAFGQSHYNLSPTFTGSFDGNIGGTIALPPIEDIFIEDVVKTIDGRVMVLYSARDELHGTYSSQKLTSGLYPMFSDVDAMDISGASELVSGEIKIVLIIIEAPDTSPTQFPDVFAMPDESDTEVGAPSMGEENTLISNLMTVTPMGVDPPPDIPVGRFFFHTIDDLLDIGATKFQSGLIVSNIIVVIPTGTSPPANVEAVFFEDPTESGAQSEVKATSINTSGTNELKTIVIVYVSNPTFDLDGTDIAAPSWQSGSLT